MKNRNITIGLLIILFLGYYFGFYKNVFHIFPKRIDQEVYQSLVNKAHEYYKAEDYENALTAINKAIEMDPNNRNYRSLYGIQLALGNYAEADLAMQKVVELAPELDQNWVEYADFKNYYVKASFEEVSAVYMQGLEATNNSLNLLTGYSRYLAEMKKYDMAVTYLEKALAANPEGAKIYKPEIEKLKTMR